MRQPFVGAGSVWRQRGVWRRYGPDAGKPPGGRVPHNQLRNAAGSGAVAGTPGTLPTSWVATTPIDGLARNIIGSGVDAATNLPYVDVQWAGTSGTAGNTTLLAPGAQNFIVAAVDQTWTASVYLALVGGSLTNVTLLTFGIRYNNGAASSVTSQTVSALGVTAAPTRYSTTFAAADATTAFVNCTLVANFTNSSAVDMTLRIIAPQISRGAAAGSAISTSGAVVVPMAFD